MGDGLSQQKKKKGDGLMNNWPITYIKILFIIFMIR